MSGTRIGLTLGPLMFNWPADRVGDFYARIADEADVDRVYLGEVVCGKRAPLLEPALAAAAERLERAGKEVVWSGLSIPANRRDRRAIASLSADGPDLIEVNDVSALASRNGPFVAGPLLNIYNEAAAQEMMARGCVRLVPNVELPLSSIAAIAKACPGLEIELFAFGRLPLALSGRCYHARVHGLHKDSCQFVCDRDLDGLAVFDIEGRPFLAANGVQTLSHGVQAAAVAPEALRAAGVGALRLSPHTSDMVAAAGAFRRFLDGAGDRGDLLHDLAGLRLPGALVGGYLAGAPGADPVH